MTATTAVDALADGICPEETADQNTEVAVTGNTTEIATETTAADAMTVIRNVTAVDAGMKTVRNPD